MVSYKLPIIMLILFVASACDSAGPTNVVIHSTPAPVETKPVISQPAPTKTTSTPRPIVTSDMIGTAYVQDKSTALAAENTLVSQYSSPCDLISSNRDFSPNGEWMAELCTRTDDPNLMLAFSSKENNTNWNFPFQDFIPQTLESPDGGMSVVHWSSDGRYAYFRSYIGSDGGECFRAFDTDGVGLFRVDLQHGNLTTLLPVRDSFAWYSFTFSPTDRRLVYGNLGRALQILDLKTGASLEVQSPSPFSQADAYLWSSDGLTVIYSTVLYDEAGNTVEYALRWLDADSGKEQILLRSEQNCFKVQGWKDSNVLRVESFNSGLKVSIIEYDLGSNQVLSENTATPFPQSE